MEERLAVALGDRLVRSALESSGWRPSYRGNSTDLLAPLRREGYSNVAGASEILALLGGLEIHPKGALRRKFSPPALKLDPRDVAIDELERIREIEERLGVRLCPIGEWGGDLILLVDENGRILAESPTMLFILGDDLASALKLMIRGTPEPVRLPR
jgi:SUKH-3 immunity protein